MRPGFPEIYAAFARKLSERSTCKRRAVGCVITSTDFRYVYGHGYNGGASGEGVDACNGKAGACGCLHAEDNAVINNTASRHEPKYVFVTMAPCETCAARLINLGGVARVYYLDEYRCTAGLDRLREAHIPTQRITGI